MIACNRDKDGYITSYHIMIIIMNIEHIKIIFIFYC